MGYKVLIVDDITVNRAVVKVALESIEDIEFIEAVDGVEALEIVNEQEISLVILDLMMPIKDGFEVLKEMKNTPTLCDIPVIVYSGNDDVESINEALELGAYDYFTKPLKHREMKVILPMKAKNALKNYEQRKKIQSLNLKMQVDLLMANFFQQSLLSEKMDMPNAIMYGKYIPTQEIGGNFYECMQVNDTIWFIMADAGEDGVSAAMLSSMLKVEFQHCARLLHSPETVLRFMNNIFCRITHNKYSLTAFVGMIRDNELWYSNANQPYPLVFNAEHQMVQVLRESDLALGTVEEHKYSLHKIKIAPGDIIITYTQGLIEDKIMNDSVGVYDDLAKYFLSYKSILDKDVSKFFANIFQSFGNMTNKSVSEDMSMMLVCMK